MSKTNSLHYQLCCEGAKYILQKRAKERWQTPNKWSVVEIVCMGGEMPDVWATNSTTTTIIEVKTSIEDFRRDKKKKWRTVQGEKSGLSVGNFRYYLCPKEISEKIKNELPEHWGLLIWNGKKIERIVHSDYFNCNRDWDMFIVCSILSREVGTHKIFNYRQIAK